MCEKYLNEMSHQQNVLFRINKSFIDRDSFNLVFVEFVSMNDIDFGGKQSWVKPQKALNGISYGNDCQTIQIKFTLSLLTRSRSILFTFL